MKLQRRVLDLCFQIADGMKDNDPFSVFDALVELAEIGDTAIKESDVHDYPVKLVIAEDLDETMVIVGESGGLSAVYAKPVQDITGFRVETEHGQLWLNPYMVVEVYDYDGEGS